MSEGYLTAEARARVEIDRQLAACGWVVQDRTDLNLYAGQGVAVRELIMASGHGPADYLLFVDGKAVGAVEAKPSGTPLAGVESQSAKYAASLPRDLPALVSPLPFLYESTGDETMFADGFDPEPRSRPVVTFHRPETLARWLRHWIDDADAGSLRARLDRLGPVPADGLRRIQVEAIGRIGCRGRLLMDAAAVEDVGGCRCQRTAAGGRESRALGRNTGTTRCAGRHRGGGDGVVNT